MLTTTDQIAAAVSFVVLHLMNKARPATLVEWGFLFLAVCLYAVWLWGLYHWHGL